MQFNTYTSAGAHIAAALVNDPMTGVAAVGALLAGFDVEEPTPSEAELADLRDWTARLRSVFEPQAEAERATLVNDLLVESDCRPRLITHDGLPHHLHYKPLAGDLAARVKAFTAAGLAYLIAEGWGGRLGRCQREGLCHRVRRHLAQRHPALLQRPLRQPGQREQSPGPAPAG